MFKRSSSRYGDTPAPVTPYQKAGQAWDERIGAARVQAANWRWMAFGCLILAIGLAGGVVWQTGQSRVTPYVIEVDRFGAVVAVGPAEHPYEPTGAQIAYHLARFIRNVRGLSIDPIVVRKSWLEAYDYATDRGAQLLNAYALINDPFKAVGDHTVSVEVISVVRASADSFQIKWTEEIWKQGARIGIERWTGILTIVIQPPRDVVTLRKNPLGIYVHGLDWSRELNPGEAP
jgi:type IV secretion system protein TrbF